MKNFDDYMTIKEAAELLGVSPSTLRNWGREGKIRTLRHPINRYRLYMMEDLKIILDKIRDVES